MPIVVVFLDPTIEQGRLRKAVRPKGVGRYERRRASVGGWKRTLIIFEAVMKTQKNGGRIILSIRGCGGHGGVRYKTRSPQKPQVKTIRLVVPEKWFKGEIQDEIRLLRQGN